MAIEFNLTGNDEPETDGLIILGAENRVTPRFKTDAYRAAPKNKALPAGFTPPSPGTWEMVYRELLKNASGLVSQLTTEKIGARAFIDQFDQLLHEAHARSWFLGRYQAGDTHDMDLADVLAGRAAADMDGYYLQGFQKAIENGEYGGIDREWREGAINQRVSLYANKTRGTANEAFVAASPVEMEMYWTLGAAEHCPDCLDLHGMNPWYPDDVYINPGDGATVCITNCRCSWVRKDGVRGFDAVH